MQVRATPPKKRGPFENWLPFVDAFRTLLLRPTPELEALFNDLRKPDWIIPYVQQCQHEGEREYVNSLNGF